MQDSRIPDTPAAAEQDSVGQEGSISPNPRPPSTESSSLQSRASPELTGGVAHEGPYLGSASGIAFFNRALQRLRRDQDNAYFETSLAKASEASSVFGFGDKTFPYYSEDMLTLPPWSEALDMVNKHFDLVSPTYRFLHRGTVTRWLSDMYQYDETPQIRVARVPSATAAILLMVFADVTLFNTDVENFPSESKDESYQLR